MKTINNIKFRVVHKISALLMLLMLCPQLTIYLLAQCNYPAVLTISNKSIPAGTFEFFGASQTIYLNSVVVASSANVVVQAPQIIGTISTFQNNVKFIRSNPCTETYGTTYNDLLLLNPTLKSNIDTKTKPDKIGPYPSSQVFGTWALGAMWHSGAGNFFQKSIDQAIEAGVTHVMVYALTPDQMVNYYQDCMIDTNNDGRLDKLVVDCNANARNNYKYILNQGLKLSLIKNGNLKFNNDSTLNKNDIIACANFVNDLEAASGKSITYYLLNDEMNYPSPSKTNPNVPDEKYEFHQNYSNSVKTFKSEFKNAYTAFDVSKFIIGPLHLHTDLFKSIYGPDGIVPEIERLKWDTWQLSELVTDKLDLEVSRISLSYWPTSPTFGGLAEAAKYTFYDTNPTGFIIVPTTRTPKCNNIPCCGTITTGYNKGSFEHREIALLHSLNTFLNQTGAFKGPVIIGGANLPATRYGSEKWIYHQRPGANILANQTIIHFFENVTDFSFLGNLGYSGDKFAGCLPIIDDEGKTSISNADRTDLWEVFRTLNQIIYKNNTTNSTYYRNDNLFAVVSSTNLDYCEILTYGMVRQKNNSDYELYIFVLSPMEKSGTATISVSNDLGFNYPVQIPLYYDKYMNSSADVKVNSLNYKKSASNVEFVINVEPEPQIIRLVKENFVKFENPIPTSVTASASPNPICVGSTLALAGGATGATNWSWTGPNLFSSTLQSPNIVNITTAGAGIYTLTASNSSGSSAPVSTASVVVNSVPTSVTASASPNPICVGSTLTLSGGATGATNWSWTGPNLFTSPLQSPPILNITTSQAGIYTLTASNACGSAAPVSTASVVVTANPSATISYSSPFCNSVTTAQSVILTGTTGGTYTASPAGLTINSLTGAITPSTSTAGAYTVTYTIAASGGCNAFSTTANVTINNGPSQPSSISGVNPVCNNALSNNGYSIGSVTGADGYTWGVPAGATITSGQGTTNIRVDYPANFSVGTLSVYAYNSCGNSPSTSLNVTVASSPTNSTTMFPACSGTTCNGLATINVSGGTPPYSYSWNLSQRFGSTNEISGICENEPLTTIVYDVNFCEDTYVNFWFPTITSTCGGTTTLTTSTGSLSDGSGGGMYCNNQNCSWLIQPAGAVSITLSFSSFATEPSWDYVKVYNGTSDAGTLLGSFSGTFVPSPVTANSGSMFVKFTTDSSNTAQGWSASYTSIASCNYILETYDSYGDAWNGGGHVTFYINGSGTNYSGASCGLSCPSIVCPPSCNNICKTSFTINVPDGASLSMSYTAGSWDCENSYVLKNSLGSILSSGGPPIAAGTIWSGTAGCGVAKTGSLFVPQAQQEEPQVSLSGITIYPNPTPGSFVVDMIFDKEQAEVMVSVTNILGEVILKHKLNNIKKEQHQIDLSKYGAGIYFIQVESGVISEKRKVVVIR